MSPESGRRWPWWLRALVGVFAVIGVFYVGMLMLMSSTGCLVTNLAIVPSISGATVAKISERRCGREAPIVEITVNRDEPDGRTIAESVFAAPEKSGESGGYAKIPVRVAWTGGDELQVYYPYALPFRNRVEEAIGVKVSYHEVSPGSH